MTHNSRFFIMARSPKRAKSWHDHLIDWMEHVLNHPLVIFFPFCCPHLLSSLQSCFSHHLPVPFANLAHSPLSEQCRITLRPKTIRIYSRCQSFKNVGRFSSGLGGTHFFTRCRGVMKKFRFFLWWVLMVSWPGFVMLFSR